MKLLTKITIGVVLIVAVSVVLQMWLKQSSRVEVATSFPVGEQNAPDTGTGIIPSDVGFNSTQVRPFDTLLTTEPAPTFISVLDSIYLDVYGVFPCNLDAEKTNVIMFTAKAIENSSGNPYRDAESAIATWEPRVLIDIGKLIFPMQTLPNAPGLASFINVPDTEYKRASVYLQNQESSIYTGWRLNYVFYASSQACLEGAMDLVYAYD